MKLFSFAHRRAIVGARRLTISTGWLHIGSLTGRVHLLDIRIRFR